MGTHLRLPERGTHPNFFGPYLLWSCKLMDGSRCHMVWRSAAQATLCQMETHFPYPKRGQSPPPNFRHMSIVAKRLIDQDGTLHRGGPRSRPHCCADGDPAAASKKAAQPPIFGPFLLWPLGMEVGLSPGHIVLGGDPAPRPKRGHSLPNFQAIAIAAQRLDGSR